MDDRYRGLLTLLQRSAEKLHPSIVPAASELLGVLPLPLPTTLAASIIASPVWNDSSLSSIVQAFRYSVHQKVKVLLEPSPSALSLSPSPSWQYRAWMRAISSGLRHGRHNIRFSALSGLLLGMEDVKDRLEASGARNTVEDEVIIAFADCFDVIYSNESWSSEQSTAQGSTRAGESLLVIASDALTLVSADKLRVLDLPGTINLFLSSIISTFNDGKFLKDISLQSNNEGLTSVLVPEDGRRKELESRLPRLARLVSRSIDVLVNNASSDTATNYDTLEEVVDKLLQISIATGKDWASLKLWQVPQEQLSVNAAAATTEIWGRLKAMFFTVVMILQSTVDSLVYSSGPRATSNANLASKVIMVFAHLTFVSSKFGGLLSRGEISFREYHRTFYTAVDIVAASPPKGEELVVSLKNFREALIKAGDPGEGTDSVALALSSFYLTVVELLVDQISTECIKECIIPVCRSYLNQPENRESFESSHSVMLALFASLDKRSGNTMDLGGLLKYMVPFYLGSLIEGTKEGKLNTDQLRLAAFSLVKGVSSLSDGTALVGYCVESLWSEIERLRTSGVDPERLSRMGLVFISILPCFPVHKLLPWYLQRLGSLVEFARGQQKTELLGAIHNEILKRVGDAERGPVLKWWFDRFGDMQSAASVLQVLAQRAAL